MISLLVVNYRSAAMARMAVESARAATAGPMQVVVVDNSVDAAEAEALRACAPDALVVAPENRGYAGGINLGRPSCRGAVIVIANPDVVFAPGSIDALADALTGSVAASGPALFWDAGLEWRLPPGDVHTAPGKLDEILAARSAGWHRERDRRRIRRRAAFWALDRITPVETLSGAVLAVRAGELDAIGGFDTRFRLYFEETDFLRQLRARRRRVVVVPEARCRHVYNQSAGQDAVAAEERWAESERRYLEKWNGPLVARTLARLGRPARGLEAPLLGGTPAVERDGLLVEASPLPGFGTAAGRFSRQGAVRVPPEVLESLRGAALYVRVVDPATGEVHGVWRAA